MCGLAGIWRTDGERESELRQDVGRMAATLVHRGPDDSGSWIDAQVGVAFGFRRLAVVDLSDGGHQPMVSSDGRYVIAFNGEIYNFKELRAGLEQLGFAFRSRSDTEVILNAASAWGVNDAVPRLWGMFAFALWDRQRRLLSLVRDRVGKKPLYYGRCGRTFLFGSELKALRAHPDCVTALDDGAVLSFVRLGYVAAPGSIYRGISSVPPGSIVHVGDDIVPSVHTYWTPTQAERARPLAISDRDAVDELEKLLRDSVTRRLVADVPVGALLSGGVDSSAVVALMQTQASSAVRTFTVGFNQAAYDESSVAKAVAGHLGTEHHELFVSAEEARDVIPLLPDVYDEPFADSSQIPTFLVSRLTRKHVTVGLSGDGGDELFGGYTRYQWASFAWSWMRWSPRRVREWSAELMLRGTPETIDKVYRPIARLLPSAMRVAFAGDKLQKFAEIADARNGLELYEGLVSIWKRPLEILAPEFRLVASRHLADALPSHDDSQSMSSLMMQLDLRTYLPDDILVKVDRASMSNSLEMRAPLLDHRVIEWVSRLPMRFKIRGRTSKWLLREVLYRHVPRRLVDRPKMGFGVPIGEWLRGPLRDWAESLLEQRELAASGVFNPSAIRQAWHAHLSGSRNHQHRLWVVLMFQAWRQRWSA